MTHKVGTKGQVVIPKAIRDEIGIKPGDEVVFEPDGTDVRVRRVADDPCDVSRHRRQMSWDIVDTSSPSDRLVVAARIECQPADQLAGLGVEHADVAIGDKQLDRLALVGATEADVVQL
jgi:AbrB family looped-hinge helix DNA binding protein